jgi:hypothetical protein
LWNFTDYRLRVAFQICAPGPRVCETQEPPAWDENPLALRANAPALSWKRAVWMANMNALWARRLAVSSKRAAEPGCACAFSDFTCAFYKSRSAFSDFWSEIVLFICALLFAGPLFGKADLKFSTLDLLF